jgi:hypothetical protein
MRGAAAGLLLATLACSKLPSGEGGVVALELRLPAPAYVEPGDTVTLRARALDAQGDSVDARIVWRVLDSTLILVDSAGRITTDTNAGSGRVQAALGRLFSDLQTLNIRPRSDTLVLVGPAVDTVLAGDTASNPLVAAVQNLALASGVAATTIQYAVVEPTAVGRVWFAGRSDTIRVTTGSTGQPIVGVTLRRTGSSAPDSVHVSVLATRPSTDTVPGSGQQFTVIFQ